ncbi:hypothetical protein ANN_07254 [Periplaneta americana]|uniref:Uncharacterized protein n=1 Tax=Periplaneta americana TaxID=6978 RepID=A0ABQ8TGP8_PERAM|nr:hypothetical protein ANN_07254 [Periplaneta americana]
MYFFWVTGVAACSCPHDYTAVSDMCVLVGPKTDWLSALKECLRAESSTSLINAGEPVLRQVVATLLSRGIPSIWVEARRSRMLDPIVYQLQTSTDYAKQLAALNPETAWLEGEPALEVDRDCMVLSVGNVTLQAKLDVCSTPAHHFVCVTRPCADQDYRCAGRTAIQTEQPATKLEIRQEGTRFFLDVYGQEGLWEFSDTHHVIVNPTCVIEDGSSMVDRLCLLDPQRALSWTARNLTGLGTAAKDLQLSITKTVYRVISENQGYIICQALRAGSLDVVSTHKQLFRSSTKNHVYAASLRYRAGMGQCPLWVCEPTYALAHWKSLAHNLTEVLLTEFRKISVRPVKMAARTEGTLTLLFRIEVPAEPRTEETEGDYKNLHSLRQALTGAAVRSRDSLEAVVYVRSSKFCHAQDLKSNGTLSWPTAAIGQEILPDQLCVSSEGVVVQQHCRGDFVQGGFWAEKTLRAERKDFRFQCSEPSSRTRLLYELSEHRQSTSRTLQTLGSALAECADALSCTAADVLLASRVIAGVEDGTLEKTDLPVVASVADSVMKVLADGRMLQSTSNASNVILESLDRLLNTVDLDFPGSSSSPTLTVTPRFVSLVADIEENDAGIQGLAVLKTQHKFFRQEDVVRLSSHHTVDLLLTMNVSAAVIMPPQLTLSGGRHRLVVSLFWDDSLFVSDARVSSPVVSVALDGRRHLDLQSPLLLMFGSSGGECVFWRFEAAGGRGNWSDAGCAVGGRGLCVCTHLTHFGQLLAPVTQDANAVLDIISAVGCVLSLLGLGGVALTAALFPAWRQGASQKVQLHLCASLALLMGTFLLDASGWRCPLLGVALHFSLLASFCWMLVAAWFQYRRLTRPLASLRRTPHILLKSGVFAWGLPVVPCAALLLTAPQAYDPPRCYPSGMAHLLSVVVPVAVVVSLNVAVFVLITHSICRPSDLQSNGYQCRRSVATRRVSTLVFLFFLLGLSWLFGIWQLSYLFCSTATLQGLAFFVFFVVLEKSTRARWQHLCHKKRNDPAYTLCNRGSLAWDSNRWSLALKRSTTSSSS